MADPRNTIGYDDIKPVYETRIVDAVTITYDGTKARGAAATMIDKAVTLSGNGTVALAADGDAVHGRLESVDPDGKCSVQTGGNIRFPGGASATLTRGTKIVGALGAGSAKGYIRSAASATAAELIKCKGEIVDTSDTTAVVVRF